MQTPIATAASIFLEEQQRERGIVLVLFAIIIAVIVGIVALVVDHSRLSLAVDTMQRAADASALSGARRFNGKIEGWREAKTAALLALKQNPILGINPDELEQIRLTQGDAAYDSPGTLHPGSMGSSGRLEVIVERGVMWHDYRLSSPPSEQYPTGRPGGYRFVSLEDGAVDSDMPIPMAVDGFLISNAMRVTVRVDSLATTFGRIFDVLGFDNLERSSVAVTHGELERWIAPVAIPLCALRLNDEPYATEEELELDYIKFSASCTRQGLATEADPKRELPAFRGSNLEAISQDRIITRRMGLNRFERGIRPIYAEYDPARGVTVCYNGTRPTTKHNCKTIPLMAILGEPSAVPGQTTNASRVAEAFASGITARPGMFWSGLETLRGFELNTTFSDVVAIAIQNNPVHDEVNSVSTFFDEFTAAYQGNDAIRVATRSFPFTRTVRPSCGNPGPADDQFDPELRPCLEDDPSTLLDESEPLYDLLVSWPTNHEVDGEPVEGRMLMDRQEQNPPVVVSRQPLDYTNPMCHHPAIPIDSVNSGGDPRRHLVRKTLAAVISPGVRYREDGRPVVYCNPEGLFAGYVGERELASVAPVKESHPVIVGFIPVVLYDVGLKNLDAIPAFQPTGPVSSIPGVPPVAERVATPFWTDPVTGEVIVDRYPGELDTKGNVFTNRAKGYVEDFEEEHEEWRGCVEGNGNGNGNGKGKGNDDDDGGSCEEQRPTAQGGEFLGIPEEYLRCFDFRTIFRDENFGNLITALNNSPVVCDPPTINQETGLPNPPQCRVDQDSGSMFNKLTTFFDKNIPALPFTHCLPRKDIADGVDNHNPGDPDYYVQPFDVNRAGMGCGGVLFRTACGTEDGLADNTIFLPGGIAWDATTPTLVAEDEERE